MKNRIIYVLPVILVMIFASCVSKKQLLDAQMQARSLQNDSALMASKIADLQASINKLQADLNAEQQKNAQLNNEANNKQGQLTDLQQNLQAQQKRLQELQNLLDQQKAKAAELRNKMKAALVGFNDSDLTITQKNG